MKRLAAFLIFLGVAGGFTSAQTIDQQPLAPPGEEDVQAEEEAEDERSSRFIRAPFRTYRDGFGPFLPKAIEGEETAEQPGTRLRQLDKMTGVIQTVDVPSGTEVTLDRLRVRVESCRTRDEEGASGAISLLKIWDARDVDQEPVFSGWMFAESPALSALDHPRYDVWVMSCIAASGGTPSANE
ncbi:MAG: DUF2155 domain-containing protein [Pseudomonadota bacterium]